MAGTGRTVEEQRGRLLQGAWGDLGKRIGDVAKMRGVDVYNRMCDIALDEDTPPAAAVAAGTLVLGPALRSASSGAAAAIAEGLQQHGGKITLEWQAAPDEAGEDPWTLEVEAAPAARTNGYNGSGDHEA